MGTAHELPSESNFHKLRNWFGQFDRLTKTSIIAMFLILITIPVIVTQETNIFSRATNNNLLQNGSFESYNLGKFPNWDLNMQITKYAKLNQDTGDKIEGNASAKIQSMNAINSSAGIVQLQQANITLNQKSYSLSFWIKTDKNKIIDIAIQQSNSPYNVYVQQPVSVTTNWTQKTIIFTMLNPETNAKIVFNLAATAGTIWLDNVVLTETSKNN